MPTVTSSDNPIPTIPINKCFTYLGKLFNASMDTEEDKSSVITKLKLSLEKLTKLHIKPQTKLKILSKIIYPRISFELKVNLHN